MTSSPSQTASRWLLALLVSTSGLLISLEDASAATFDRIIARVNDEIITLYELEKAATPYLLQNGMNPAVLDDPQRRGAVLNDVLDDLVDRELLIQEAAKLNLRVTDEQVDQWLAFTQQQQNLTEDQFANIVRGYGMTFDEYRENIRANLLELRIVKVKIGSQVEISERELQREYERRFGPEAGREKHIDLRHILIRPADNSEASVQQALRAALALRQRIADGEAFVDLAREASMGPAADEGGYLGTFRRGDLSAPAVEEAAFSLATGQISEVVRSEFGFHILKVDRIELRDSDDVEARRNQLRAQMQQAAIDEKLAGYLDELRSRSFVRVDLDPSPTN